MSEVRHLQGSSSELIREVIEKRIIHIDLSTELLLEVIPASFSEGLTVFWWRDCPIGEVYYVCRHGQTVSPSELAAVVSRDELKRAKQIVDNEMVTYDLRLLPSTTVVICTKDRPPHF